MDTHPLLHEEGPLLLRPTLACVLAFAGLTPGDRQALWTQQLNYWIQVHRQADRRRKHYHEGRWWVWNSLAGWQAQFPFWSRRTMERTIERSIEGGVTLAGNHNQHKYDRTLWYAIDYERLADLERAWAENAGSPLRQDDETEIVNSSSSSSPERGNGDRQNGEMDDVTMGEPIPESTIDASEKERQSAWSLACKELEMQMTQATFAAWIRPLKLVRVAGQDGAPDGVTRSAVICCPNAYVHDWCQHRLGARIAGALAGALDVPPAALDVRYVVAQNGDLSVDLPGSSEASRKVKVREGASEPWPPAVPR